MVIKSRILAALLAIVLLLSACTAPSSAPDSSPSPPSQAQESPSAAASPSPSESPSPEETPEESHGPDDAGPVNQTRRRNFYEIFVGAFCDSDGDGMGDLQGVISKLDYLTDLGINAIWFMPINPSPTYHKYDVADYYGIDPKYGTMADFDELLAQCNARGIDIILDLVLNHSSTQHPWFKEATAALKDGSESIYTQYYNFSETKEDSGWYKISGAEYYYEANFWSGMPDLNMDCKELRDEVADISKFWLDKGVLGFRLDAAKHVYDTPAQNYEFWGWFSAMCKEIKEDVFLIAEVWDSDSVMIPYYETGLTAIFNFSFAGAAGSINQNVKRGDGVTLAANIERWDKLILGRNPEGIHSPFLSNHDTDRSAGYINDVTLQKLEAAIYLLIPGSPFIYYGEEIGMTGKGKDENKRTAMFWSASDPAGIANNPSGTEKSVVPPEQGVAEQLADPDSLLNYYRAILELKALFPDVMDGLVSDKYELGEKCVCAFRAGEVVIVHNLSGVQVEVDISGVATELGGFISPTDGPVILDGSILTIPPYASLILE